MVGKKNNPRNPIKNYAVYLKGQFLGILALDLAHVKKMESAGYRLKPAPRLTGHNPIKVRKNVKRSANPKGLVLIYRDVTRIEATKGKNSQYPGQRFFHNFKRPYPSMYGTTINNRKVLIIK